MSDTPVEEEELCEEVRDRCSVVKSDESSKDQISMFSTKENNSQRGKFSDFHMLNDPTSEEPISGRISRNSNQSTYSSASESCSQSESNNISSSSSGRSSFAIRNKDQPFDEDEMKQLNNNNNQNSNLCPEVDEVMDLIEAVRLKFLESLKEQGSSEYELYDDSDLVEIKRAISKFNDKEQSLAFRLISRYVNAARVLDEYQSLEKREKIIKETVDSLKGLLKVRNRYQIPTTVAEHFSKEHFLLNGIFSFGVDKEKLPVLYIRARVHRKWSQTLDESFRKFVVWQVDLLTKSYKGAQVAKSIGINGFDKDGTFSLIFDCNNINYSCLDMDFLKFLVNLFLHYYPSYCRHVWVLDLPWLFRSVWKLVRTWLPAESKVQLITSKQLVDFIDEDQIANCVKTSDENKSDRSTSGKHMLPKNFNSIRNIEDMAKELNLSSNEVKQFKAHVEKLKKEYEQSG